MIPYNPTFRKLIVLSTQTPTYSAINDFFILYIGYRPLEIPKQCKCLNSAQNVKSDIRVKFFKRSTLRVGSDKNVTFETQFSQGDVILVFHQFTTIHNLP